jgi:hypothetical protein
LWAGIYDGCILIFNVLNVLPVYCIDMLTLSRPPPPLPFMCWLCPIRNDIQRCTTVKENLRWKGPNSITNFHHHNIHEGAADLH